MNKMKLRQLGSTDLFISPLGLGTVKFGRNQQVKYPQSFLIPDDKIVRQLLHQAHDLGVNLLDTAPAYGNSEERLGKLLKGQRQNWVIVSKTGEEFVDDQSQYDFSKAHTRLSVERSLQRLKTDYLDLILIHSNGDDLTILQQTEVISTLAELKKAGLIRAYGMSTKTIDGGQLAVNMTDAVMVSYNPEHQDEQSVIEYAHAQKKGVLIKKALSSGHLNKFSLQDRFEFIFHQIGVNSIIIGTLSQQHLTQSVHLIDAITK